MGESLRVELVSVALVITAVVLVPKAFKNAAFKYCVVKAPIIDSIKATMGKAILPNLKASSMAITMRQSANRNP